MTMGTWARPPFAGAADEAMADRSSVDEMLTKMAELLREARPAVLVSGFTVAGAVVGATVEMMALPLRLTGGLGTALWLGLFAVLALSVMRTAALTVAAGRPLLDELGELRRQVGAPVQPNVPWRPVQTRTAEWEAPAWDRLRGIIAAAHFRNLRAHAALTWATATLMSFAGWTLMTLILVGRL